MSGNDCNVSTFCWSPKGKQIVISHNAANFVQYKLQLNEQNLVLSNGLQETKRIQLPESFQSFRVSNIFWLSTFNFVIIGRNDEDGESCFILVSIPSSKATGADAVIKIVDFGRLILESPTESNESFEGNIYPLENLIFFFTNKSSDFAIIGSTSPELTVADNWSEITNDDNYRLMFSEADESLQIRGLSFAHGTQKQFQLSTSIIKGGIHQPFVLAYNSHGHLTLFLIDYENGSEFIKVPTVPKCVKPQVAEQHQPAPLPITTTNLQSQSRPVP
ncbi:nuclear pore complex protein nup214-like protein, partial [Euroglyphus maynei]